MPCLQIQEKEEKRWKWKFASEITDKQNEQWKEREGIHGHVSKDKNTVLHFALNLQVLYFDLGEEIPGRIATSLPMVNSP